MHYPRGREVPQVHILAKVRRDVQIQQPVAVVVEPNGAVAVHPASEPRGSRHILEASATQVSKEGQVSITVNENILVAVVIHVTPHGTHRHSLSRTIDVGQSRARRHILESAIASIPIERVIRAEAAVGEIEVRPAVGVEIGH